MNSLKISAFTIITGLITLFYGMALYDKITRPTMKNLDGTGFTLLGLFVLTLLWIDYSMIKKLINENRRS